MVAPLPSYYGLANREAESESGRQNAEATHGFDTGCAEPAAETLRTEAKRDTGYVEKCGGHDKTKSEFQCGCLTKLAAMSRAVEEGEEADQSGADAHIRAEGGCNGKAENNGGGQNHRLDYRQGDPRQRKPEARKHGAHEGQRHHPQGTTANQAGPKTYRNHSEDVVKAGQRMGETRRDGTVFA